MIHLMKSQTFWILIPSSDLYALPSVMKVGPKPSVASIIPEAGFSKISTDMTDDLFMPEVSDCPPQYVPIIPEIGVSKSSLKATNCPPQYAPLLPEVGVSKSSLKATQFPLQYTPIIPAVGLPKSLLNFANGPSQHAGLTPEFILTNVSETDEPTSMYSPEFSSFLYNHQTTTSSIEPQPSTSNAVHDIYSPSYSSLDKSLMSLSYDNYNEDDDYSMKRA
ncbi:uncharacterized protein LOC100678649 [Nasonia vitripennis]|uniref:Uncharacterized protein n=1 Tax=Nasonia vitripennis TaxID=7425 RepID=A0A7M7QM64_NASVI|nr:uncharacterized protein LOC100678649 [Nasonia vitripennis]